MALANNSVLYRLEVIALLDTQNGNAKKYEVAIYMYLYFRCFINQYHTPLHRALHPVIGISFHGTQTLSSANLKKNTTFKKHDAAQNVIFLIRSKYTFQWWFEEKHDF